MGRGRPMDTETRVKICRLLEKIINNPEYANKIAIEYVEASSGKSQ